MGTTATCPKCGPREPSAVEPVPTREGYRLILRDWRTWSAAFAAMLASGVAAGVFGLGTGAAGAGGGAAIGLMLASRAGALKRCRQCGSTLRG